MGHSPGSTHRGAEQLPAPLPHPGGAFGTPCLTCAPHFCPSLGGAACPSAAGSGGSRYRTSLSPEPRRVFPVAGVRMGPGGARSKSRSTPWFSLLEKWSLPRRPRPSPSSARGPCCVPSRPCCSRLPFQPCSPSLMVLSVHVDVCPIPAALTSEPGAGGTGQPPSLPAARGAQGTGVLGALAPVPSPAGTRPWPGNAGSCSGGLKRVLSAGTTC